MFSQLPSETRLEAVSLELLPATGPSAGSRPQTTLRDADDRRYLFKLAPPEQIAAELFAARVRALGRRLHVPAARRSLELPDLGRVTGLLQPMIPVEGTLDPEPLRWSRLQHEQLLLEHPWEWLLGNLDTHVDQYVMVGEHRLPINIDWDHSLVDLDETQLTRFCRRSATVAPIRNLLYAEYVSGRLDLDFFGMSLQARKLAELPDGAFVELLDRHTAELGLSDDAHRELSARMFARKASLVADFDALVESLQHERDDNLGVAETPRSGMVRLISHVQDAWQRFVIVVLHAHVLRPILRGYRAVLNFAARARR